VTLGVLIVSGARGGWQSAAFFGLVLVSMSLNRFMLAGLSASLEHTIDADEYLTANSVMPIVGPVGTIIGAGTGTIARLTLASVWETYQVDALLFGIAGIGFLISLSVSLGFAKTGLGPHPGAISTTARSVLSGLSAALGHIVQHRPAALGLVTLGIQRIWFGAVSVGVILLFRNYFHPVADINPALADLGVWGGLTAAGFVAASFVTPLATRRWGLRAWITMILLACGVFQILPGSILVPWALFTAALVIGMLSQSIKICVDTLVQAHLSEEYKGRAFVWYDILLNVVQVASAAGAAAILPPDGASAPVFVVFGLGYLVTGIGFIGVSRLVPAREWAKGVRQGAS
jgi:hypothetical protein